MFPTQGFVWALVIFFVIFAQMSCSRTDSGKAPSSGVTKTNNKAEDSETDSKAAVTRELEKPVIRGGIVFKTYCTLCHGERGDGASRAAKLYNNLNLVISSIDTTYLEHIIRDGGEAVGKSSFMPTWQDELSNEQIQDVVAYLSIIRNPVERGKTVFKTNCILCHGIRGDGKGRASVLFKPPPANLTRSDKNDEYKRMIIRYGGAAMGRSEKMPKWESQLSAQEIEDTVTYLRTILVGKQVASKEF